MKEQNPNNEKVFLTEVISSSSNETLKHIKKLNIKKYREEYKQFIIEGEKIVLEALNSDCKLDMLVFSESYFHPLLKKAAEMGIRCIRVRENLFNQLSDTKSPQGVLAVVHPKIHDLFKIIEHETSFLLILDGIKDPGNLGTMVRTMDAAGGDGVILLNDCVDPYNPKAVRATMGSVLRVPVFKVDNTRKILDTILQAGYHIVVSDLNGTDVFTYTAEYKRIALVIGSESHGVSSEIRAKAHCLVKIPMVGRAESLNASVAGGILIYEFFRKRMKMG